MALLEGMVGGLIIDSIGVNFGYYYFPREPIYSLSYFVIVLPCWGVFGMLVNYLWGKWGKRKLWLEMIVTYCPLLVFYEGANILTRSWVYTVPYYVVLAGWIPLILTFTGCNRRRRVVFKIESWIQKHQGQPVIVVCLNILRVLLIVVMFPLLLSALVRLLVYYSELKKTDNGIASYLKREIMMRGA
jgi:SNF family Na+-dependent transporter